MSFEIWIGDCVEWMSEMTADSVDAIVTDPPYGLNFMGKQWDTLGKGAEQHWHELWAQEALRVLKPGGHLLAFGGTRTYHRLAAGIEDAGFEVRDCIAWMHGEGFPKSHNVSKAIDKAAGAKRKVVGMSSGAEYDTTLPATKEAEQWDGWGTALKPSFEPVIVARSAFDGTLAANVIEHGTGALNVDATRIGMSNADRKVVDARSGAGFNAEVYGSHSMGRATGIFKSAIGGRWPANVIIDNRVAAKLGEPSRFFYTAKSSKAERNAGLFDYFGNDLHKNNHPTVKPINVMRWLIRLVTPPGGTVLDPFMGSGTTGCAAMLEGFDFIGIEKNTGYAQIAEARICHYEN